MRLAAGCLCLLRVCSCSSIFHLPLSIFYLFFLLVFLFLGFLRWSTGFLDPPRTEGLECERRAEELMAWIASVYPSICHAGFGIFSLHSASSAFHSGILRHHYPPSFSSVCVCLLKSRIVKLSFMSRAVIPFRRRGFFTHTHTHTHTSFASLCFSAALCSLRFPNQMPRALENT